MRHKRQQKRWDAFTLVEAMLAAVILSMTVSSIIMPFVAGAQNDLANAYQALAVTLAQDMMEEILAKPFSDPDDGNRVPGPDGSESAGRELYDNIDDYDGYTEPTGMIVPFEPELLTNPLTVQFARRVTVTYVRVAGQDVSEPADFCRVAVQVDRDPNNLVTLTRLVYANE